MKLSKMARVASVVAVALAMVAAVALVGCSGGSSTANEYGLEDGVYTVDVATDSNMFHINEAYDNTGTLTVENGEMTIHITLVSKKIINLYPGTAEEAQAEGAVLIEPTVDVVDYGDGTTGEAYGFDVPVPVLDEEFPVAILGSKENWYSHTLIVSSPESDQ